MNSVFQELFSEENRIIVTRNMYFNFIIYQCCFVDDNTGEMCDKSSDFYLNKNKNIPQFRRCDVFDNTKM